MRDFFSHSERVIHMQSNYLYIILILSEKEKGICFAWQIRRELLTNSSMTTVAEVKEKGRIWSPGVNCRWLTKLKMSYSNSFIIALKKSLTKCTTFNVHSQTLVFPSTEHSHNTRQDCQKYGHRRWGNAILIVITLSVFPSRELILLTQM